MKSISQYQNIEQFRFDSAGFTGLSKTLSDWKGVQDYFDKQVHSSLVDIQHCHEIQELELHLTLLRSNESRGQDPHIDYRWSDALPLRPNTYESEDYRFKVPFIGLSPLTEDGMRVEIWPHMNHMDYKPGNFVNKTCPSQYVEIPFGFMLLLRADTIHAGGYSSSDRGDPRFHLYVHKTATGRNHRALRGTPFDSQTTNIYRASDDLGSDHLSQIYVRN